MNDYIPKDENILEKELQEGFDIENFINTQFALITSMQAGGFKHKKYEQHKEDNSRSSKRRD